MLGARGQSIFTRRAAISVASFLAVFVLGLSAVVRAQAQNNEGGAFLAWAIQIEIQQQDIGGIAARRAEASVVRGLGDYLIERHREYQQRLQEVAKQLNVPLSDKLSATHLQVQRRFSSIGRAAFDKAFIHHEVADYRYFLTHFEAAANSGDALIQEYARSELPRLKEDQSRIAAVASRIR